MACSRLCCILSCGLFGRDATDEERSDDRPRGGRSGDGNSPTEQRRGAERRTQPAKARADPRQAHIANARASGLQPRPPVGRKGPKAVAHPPSFTSPTRVALTLHGASEETDMSQQDEVRVPMATAPPHARKSSVSPRASERGMDRSSVAIRSSEYAPARSGAAASMYQTNAAGAQEQPPKSAAADGEFWFGGAQQSGPRAAAGDSIKTKNNASAVAKSFSPGAGGLKAKLVPQKRGKGGEDGASTPGVGAGQSPASIMGRSGSRGRGRGRGGKPAASGGRNFGGTVVAATPDGDASHGIYMDESTLRRMGAQGPPVEAVEDDVEEDEHVDK
jgi:hypothetical protein